MMSGSQRTRPGSQHTVPRLLSHINTAQGVAGGRTSVGALVNTKRKESVD